MIFAGGKKQRYNEPVAGRTRLMKELFLLGQRAGSLPGFFEFRPYKYGPHSDEVLFALDSLMERSYLQSSPGLGSEIYSLTPDGVARAAELFGVLDERTRRLLTDIKIQFNGMSLPDLLDYVYSHYPRYASESEYEPPRE